jgi:hypothetical protein
MSKSLINKSLGVLNPRNEVHWAGLFRPCKIPTGISSGPHSPLRLEKSKLGDGGGLSPWRERQGRWW